MRPAAAERESVDATGSEDVYQAVDVGQVRADQTGREGERRSAERRGLRDGRSGERVAEIVQLVPHRRPFTAYRVDSARA